MRRHLHRRRVERIRLFPPLHGAIDRIDVEVDELSLDGARIHSDVPIEVRSSKAFSFVWDGERLNLVVDVTRCRLEPHSRRYESGLRFSRSEGMSIFEIHQIIASHVEEALEQQIANAEGRELTNADRRALTRLTMSASDRALLRLHDDRDHGFVRYSLAGGRWHREATWEGEQPEEGFTIWSFEEDEHVEQLCRLYERGDAQLRALLRLCAELSLYVDDGALPPQYFAP